MTIAALLVALLAGPPVILTTEDAPEVALLAWERAKEIVQNKKCAQSFLDWTGKRTREVPVENIVVADLNRKCSATQTSVGATLCWKGEGRISVDQQEILYLSLDEVALTEIHEWVHVAHCPAIEDGVLTREESEQLAAVVEQACREAIQ